MDDKKAIIYMEPDYGDALFWDEEGVDIGGPDSIDLGGDDMEPLNVAGLREWFNEWELHSLYAKKNPWIDLDWHKWWVSGYLFATEVKKKLPENIELHYFSFLDDIWKIKPENTDDGGLWHYGHPIIIE